LKPWANASAPPFFRFGATNSLYTAAMCSSGSSIMTMSALFTASATSATLRPAFFALSQDGPPLRTPTVTFMPDSCRLSACAWPCEP